jgi:hypothetical protein
MKNRKVIFISSLLFLFLISNGIHGQSKSKEELGNALVKSILSNDIDGFKSQLLPKSITLKLKENNDEENINKEERDSLRAQYEAAYVSFIIPRYEKNFQDMVNLNESNKIDWSNLSFMILYKDSSQGEEYIPFFIHTKLNNSKYKHFYFDAVRYKGEWYLSGNMEITKDDKYAPM